jgi:hypothetical protein
MRGEQWAASRLSRLVARKRFHITHLTGGLQGRKAGLEDVEKIFCPFR